MRNHAAEVYLNQIGLNTVSQMYVAEDRDHWYCPLNTTVGQYKIRKMS